MTPCGDNNFYLINSVAHIFHDPRTIFPPQSRERVNVFRRKSVIPANRREIVSHNGVVLLQPF